MLNTLFFYALIIILISRLIFEPEKQGISLKQLIFKTIFEIAFLLAVIVGKNLTVLILGIIIINFVSLFLDKCTKKYLYRFILLIIYILFFSFLLKNNIQFNQIAYNIKDFLVSQNILFQYLGKYSWNNILIYLAGVLFTIKEANNLIKYIMSTINVISENNANEPVNTIELNRGKIIGIVERILVYVLVISNNIGSIAFVITAKALARFKELENKNFAEYFLIGTLLSVSIALFAGIIIRKIILAL